MAILKTTLVLALAVGLSSAHWGGYSGSWGGHKGHGGGMGHHGGGMGGHGGGWSHGGGWGSQENVQKPGAGSGSGPVPKPGTGSGSTCNNMDGEKNKALAKEFLIEVTGQKKIDNVEKYLSKDYYANHNPAAAGTDPKKGVEDFKSMFAPDGVLGSEGPTVPDIKHICACGDMVWVHIKDGDMAVVDIFKFGCDGKVIEHWDVMQSISGANSTNPMAFFSPEP